MLLIAGWQGCYLSLQSFLILKFNVMKKVSKFLLRENVEVLGKDEMKFILGGSTYRCCCGQGSNVNCFDVNATSEDNAIWALSYICNYGGGCF